MPFSTDAVPQRRLNCVWVAGLVADKKLKPLSKFFSESALQELVLLQSWQQLRTTTKSGDYNFHFQFLLYLICENLNKLGNLVPFVSPEHVNFLNFVFEHKF